MSVSTIVALKGEDRTQAAFRSVQKSVGRLKSSFVSIGKIATLGLGVAAVKQLTGALLNTADAATNLKNKLKLVSDGSRALNINYDRLAVIAQDTRASFQGTVDLFFRLKSTTKDLAVSQSQLYQVTRTLNQAIAMSGSTSEAAEAAIIQLGQGLAAGALRGQELNSVMEQTPKVAEALASGLGVGIGTLRKMGAAGELTAERIIAAFLKQSKSVAQEFRKTQGTVDQSVQRMDDSWMRFVDSVNQGTDFSGAVSQFFVSLSQGMDKAKRMVDETDPFNVMKKSAATLTARAETLKDQLDSLAAKRAKILKLSQNENLTAVAHKKLREGIGAMDAKRVDLFDHLLAVQTRLNVLKYGEIDLTKKMNQTAKEGAGAVEKQNHDLELRRLALMDQMKLYGEGATKYTAAQELIRSQNLKTAKEAQRLDDELRERKAAIFRETKATAQSILDERLTQEEREVQEIERLHARRVELANEAANAEVINDQAKNAIILEANKNRLAAIAALERQRMMATFNTMTGMANAVADQGQAFFEFAKAANIAQATMNTYEAATKAYAQGGIFGIATAAIITALGMAQISKIAAQKPPTMKREMGGPVSANRPYLVGERGPEMFVPSGSGNITPNNEMGGPVTVNVNINAVDTVGFDELLFARRAVLVNVINQALNRQGRRGLL